MRVGWWGNVYLFVVTMVPEEHTTYTTMVSEVHTMMVSKGHTMMVSELHTMMVVSERKNYENGPIFNRKQNMRA